MNYFNDLLLRVANGEKVERPPVWIMRQAGRYLPEYRAVREKAGGFREMIRHPEFAAEVTIQPVDIVGVDAAIIFSDILVVAEALGLPYEMIESKGPNFPETASPEKGLDWVRKPDQAENLSETWAALKIVKRELAGRVPLIGFAGAPWTLFCYMTEGKGSKDFSKAKAILASEPAFAHQLLQHLTDTTIYYLKGQIAAGADIVQIFDSWAGALGRKWFTEFSLPYIQKICAAITEVPVIVFARGATHSLDLLAELPCQVMGLDWATEPETAHFLTPKMALQGNLDPSILYGDEKYVRAETLSMLKRFPPGRHVANLGHGLNPDMSVQNVKAFIETVKAFEYSIFFQK